MRDFMLMLTMLTYRLAQHQKVLVKNTPPGPSSTSKTNDSSQNSFEINLAPLFTRSAHGSDVENHCQVR
jgi:hypothetical protein